MSLVSVPTSYGNQKQHKDVADAVTKYRDLHDDEKLTSEERNQNYQDVVVNYYDLTTDFYEKGWGEHFHFAKQFRGENYGEALRRQELYLALRSHMKHGTKALDIGCGIGGPMRNIARFTNATITGLNLNAYQVKRANELNKKAGLSHLLNVVEGDFMKMPFEDNTFDVVYEIEATAHAPTKLGVYSEAFRVLKPGGYFLGYEWAFTKNYEPNNGHHKYIKKAIEEGDGLPDIVHIKDVEVAMKEAGFLNVEVRDVAEESQVPWEDPLTPKYNWSNWQMTPIGKKILDVGLLLAEKAGFAPKGTVGVQRMLLRGQEGLYLGGKLKIFTPMAFHFGCKPEQ
jgi:sterol 24-C-methyltransferase